MVLAVAALELAAVLRASHCCANFRQIGGCIEKEYFRACSTRRYLGVTGKAFDNLARPQLEGAVLAAAGIEINAAERGAVAKVTEFDPDTATRTIHEAMSARLGFRTG